MSLVIFTIFLGCNSNKNGVAIGDNAHQQVNNNQTFPRRAPSDSVICSNCRAAFKLSTAVQKQSHGHSYIECPVCHHDYRKKK